MFLKIVIAAILFYSIVIFDQVYFFPVVIVILFILRSLEKDLKVKP